MTEIGKAFVGHYTPDPKLVAFHLGDRVEKRSGYRWPGIIVSVFFNLQGEVRYVVECTTPEVRGALHIYNAGQLRKAHP